MEDGRHSKALTAFPSFASTLLATPPSVMMLLVNYPQQLHTYVLIRTHIHTHMHTHMDIYTHTSIYRYVHTYTHIQTRTHIGHLYTSNKD